MPTNVPDRNTGFSANQAQVWGFDTRTGIDSRSYFAPGAKIFYVDPNNAQAVDAGNLGEDPTVPLATVDAAVTLSRAYRGDTIVVGPNDAWQYAAGIRNTSIVETLIIPATKGGIRIVGASTNPLSVMWEAVVADDFCITVRACDVLIEGIGFTGNNGVACNGVYAEWDGVTLYGENMTVRNCVFDDGIDIAIQLEFSWYFQIYNNWFAQCDEYGVYADAGGSGAALGVITGNWFQDCGTADIALLAGSDDNSVHGNRVMGNAAGTNNLINLTAGTDNIVTDNYLGCTIAQYDTTCSDATSGAWLHNHCTDGSPVAPPT